MDKKKVIELITQSILHIDRAYKFSDIDAIEATTDVQRWLKEAIEELQKPDWISVDDELPEYWEKVLVTDKEHPNHVWISHREDEKSHRKQDKNGFPLWKFSYPYYEVTHWRRIDKLEV